MLVNEEGDYVIKMEKEENKKEGKEVDEMVVEMVNDIVEKEEERV